MEIKDIKKLDKKNRLSNYQLNKLKKHSTHHSLNHMKKMINLMTRDKNKLSFVKSHNETMKKIGK
tara:strand:+ start:1030 stop:1224 length:195 start_codon:yes stop_codon:yes gene_type:complete